MQMVLGQWSPALSFINDEGTALRTAKGTAGAQRTAKGTARGTWGTARSQGTALGHSPGAQPRRSGNLHLRRRLLDLQKKVYGDLQPTLQDLTWGKAGLFSPSFWRRRFLFSFFFTRSLVLKGLLLCNSPTYQWLAEFIETETDTGQISIMPKPDLRIFFRAVPLQKPSFWCNSQPGRSRSR